MPYTAVRTHSRRQFSIADLFGTTLHALPRHIGPFAWIDNLLLRRRLQLPHTNPNGHHSPVACALPHAQKRTHSQGSRHIYTVDESCYYICSNAVVHWRSRLRLDQSPKTDHVGHYSRGTISNTILLDGPHQSRARRRAKPNRMDPIVSLGLIWRTRIEIEVHIADREIATFPDPACRPDA